MGTYNFPWQVFQLLRRPRRAEVEARACPLNRYALRIIPLNRQCPLASKAKHTSSQACFAETTCGSASDFPACHQKLGCSEGSSTSLDPVYSHSHHSTIPVILGGVSIVNVKGAFLCLDTIVSYNYTKAYRNRCKCYYSDSPSLDKMFPRVAA